MNNIKNLLMKITVLVSILFVFFPMNIYGATSNVLKTIQSNFMFSFVFLILLAFITSIVVYLFVSLIKKFKN